jgi:hypothetical protein
MEKETTISTLSFHQQLKLQDEILKSHEIIETEQSIIHNNNNLTKDDTIDYNLTIF